MRLRTEMQGVKMNKILCHPERDLYTYTKYQKRLSKMKYMIY